MFSREFSSHKLGSFHLMNRHARGPWPCSTALDSILCINHALVSERRDERGHRLVVVSGTHNGAGPPPAEAQTALHSNLCALSQAWQPSSGCEAEASRYDRQSDEHFDRLTAITQRLPCQRRHSPLSLSEWREAPDSLHT